MSSLKGFLTNAELREANSFPASNPMAANNRSTLALNLTKCPARTNGTEPVALELVQVYPPYAAAQ
jgi:hypothetical protein